MNIKSIPANPSLHSVKATTDEQQQQGQGGREHPPSKRNPSEAPAQQSLTLTPEAADAELKSAQPVDSQTAVQLLVRSHAGLKNRRAKFPTPKEPTGVGLVKKLNRSA